MRGMVNIRVALRMGLGRGRREVEGWESRKRGRARRMVGEFERGRMGTRGVGKGKGGGVGVWRRRPA